MVLHFNRKPRHLDNEMIHDFVIHGGNFDELGLASDHLTDYLSVTLVDLLLHRQRVHDRRWIKEEFEDWAEEFTEPIQYPTREST